MTFKTREEMRNLRKDLVKQMHNYIIDIGDEDIYDIWIMVMPDEPTDEDFEWFADDVNEFRDLCKTFGKLVARDEKENY